MCNNATTVDLTNTSTTYEFVTPDGSLKGGDIVISYVNDGSSRKALYVKRIVVNPETAAQLTMSDISCTEHSSSSLTFAWDAVAGALDYEVSTDGGTSYNSTNKALSYKWENLQPSTNYTIRVKAIGDGYEYITSAYKSASYTTDSASGSITTGTVLWTDTFGSYGANSNSFVDNLLLSDYTYTGRSGYGVNATNVTLTASNNNVRATTYTGTNCTGGHLWFNKSTEASVTTSAINLYGVTSLVLTYAQGTNGSSITSAYSTDGGSSWTNLEASGPDATVTREFSVPTGTTSVRLRFTHLSSNSKNTRFDNPKLSVGN